MMQIIFKIINKSKEVNMNISSSVMTLISNPMKQHLLNIFNTIQLVTSESNKDKVREKPETPDMSSESPLNNLK